MRAVATRRVEFGYAVENVADGRLLATASTSLLSLGADMRLTAMPDRGRAALRPGPDPVRLGLSAPGDHHRGSEDTE